MAAEIFLPDVLDAGFRQLQFEILAIEVRVTARHREGANVDQGFDAVGMEGFDEFGEEA
jgi:hypothetical protein